MASSVLNFLLVGSDAGASRAIARVGAAAEATSKQIATASDKQAAAAARVNKAFNAIGKASALITVAIGIEGVKAAVSFESALTRVSTQAGVSKNDLKGLGDALLKLSPKVGFNPDDLAVALYHVESAFHSTGITAKSAIGIVEQASKLSKIGNADLETTTQAIIGVLASKIGGVKDAQDAAAQLNQLVGSGDTTLQKVSQSIATGILPTAATLGLTFKDVAAGIATLTDNVTPADTAARILKTSLLTLIKPSAQQTAAFEQLGLGALQLGQDFRKPNGLLTGVQDLKTHLDAVFPATQKTALTTDQLDKAQQAYYQTLVSGGTNAKDATKESEKYRHSIENVSVATLRANAVARALGGSKTAGVFLTFLQETDRLKSKVDEFGTSAQAATKFQQAWVQQQGTAKQKLAELDASWHVFLVQVGNAILPDLKKIVDVLAKHPGIIKAAAGAVAFLAAAWTISKFASAFAVIGRLTAAILGIGTASATAAAETAAANVGGAASAGAAGAAARGAEGAAAGGLLSRLKASPLVRVVLPVVATIGAIKVLGLQKTVGDLMRGQIGPALEDSPEWLKSVSAGIGKALKATKLPGTQGFDTGNISGSVIGKLAIKPGFVEQAQFVKADQAVISDFNKTLAITSNLVDNSSKTLVGNSAAAQTNRAAIGLLVQKAKDGADAQFRLTGKQSDLSAAMRLGVGAIESAATALGFNKGQVDALVRSLGLVPPETKAHVDVTGANTAVINLQYIKDALDRVTGQHFVDIQVLTTGTASATSIAQAAGGTGHGFGGGRVATGGLLRGPGTGTSDSLVARVSNGEYVVKASSVSKYGVGFLNSVNAGRYARGGYVGTANAGSGDVHVHVHAWDGPSVDKWLQQGGAKKIAIEVKRATGYGMTLN